VRKISMTRNRVVAAAAGVLVVAGGAAAMTANASPTDIQAITTTAQEFASDAVANAVQQNDNLTCSDPTAYGAAVVQATNVVVAEVFGEDAAVAHIECASLTPSVKYTLSGTLYIQAYYSGAWHNVASSGLKGTQSTDGAAALVLTATGKYAPPSSALGAYHRAYVVFATSTGRAPHTPSPSVWYMNN